MSSLIILISLPNWLSPLWEFLILVLGIEFLLPRIWNVIEFLWFRIALGNSPKDREYRVAAERDSKLTLRRLILDRGMPKSLAVIVAVPIRVYEVRRLTITYRRRKTEGCAEQLQEWIIEVNSLWQRGQGPKDLNLLIMDIQKTIRNRSIDRELRFHARCVVSVLRYAMGRINEGNQIGRENWETAHRLESDRQSTLKWLAAYGFMFSTLFLGQCLRATELMTGHWNRYYAALDEEEAKHLRARVSGKLILSPILAIPRHLFLAVTLSERKHFVKKDWPSEVAFEAARADDRPVKLLWFESWYAAARSICEAEPISMNFTNAYAGFLLTMMLLEREVQTETLHARINEVFAQANGSAAIVSQYVLAGFKGVYQLICSENELAYESLSYASALGAKTGNRFCDCVFTNSQAVAAARTGKSNKTIKNQLATARELAETLDSDLFNRLCDAAESAVCLHRGDRVYARQLAERSKQGRAESRILRMFEDDALDSTHHATPLRTR